MRTVSFITWNLYLINEFSRKPFELLYFRSIVENCRKLEILILFKIY